jgi:hypothetical protein
MTRLSSGIFTLILLATFASGQLRICGSCGREDLSGGTSCAVCKSPLPPIERGQPDTKPGLSNASETAPGADALSKQVFDLVKRDVEAARLEEVRRPEVALARYENARALLTLARAEHLPPGTARIVLDGLQRCRTALAVTGQTCPVCGGSGKQQVARVQLAGGDEAAAEPKLTTGAACATCGGTGAIRGRRGVEATRLLILQGRREAGLQQQAAGRVAVGRSWLPPSWPKERTPEQLAVIRRTLAAECTACAGLGLEPCRRCQGSGRQPCKSKACRQGWIEQTAGNTLTPKTALTRRVKCPDCQGTAHVDCPACRGGGSAACRGCNGTGKSEPCRSCGGEGTAPCRSCRTRAAAEPPAPCETCQGTRRMLCNRCNGEGYQSR